VIKRHPVYPYNICHNGVIMETGFADGQLLSGLGMPARGKGRLDCHTAVQTICQGWGSRGWSSGAAGAWSVRPAAPAAAPGKMYIAIIAYDIVCIHRMHISPISGDMRLRHLLYVRHRIIPMWHMHIVNDIVGNLRYRIRRRTSHRTYDWQEQ
jgi:hypothetical protein